MSVVKYNWYHQKTLTNAMPFEKESDIMLCSMKMNHIVGGNREPSNFTRLY